MSGTLDPGVARGLERLYCESMTARGEVLAAAKELSARSGDGTVTLEEILENVRNRGSEYKPSTIRTHVTSRMCSNAPDHHAVTYRDLVRVSEGTVRLNTGQ